MHWTQAARQVPPLFRWDYTCHTPSARAVFPCIYFLVYTYPHEEKPSRSDYTPPGEKPALFPLAYRWVRYRVQLILTCKAWWTFTKVLPNSRGMSRSVQGRFVRNEQTLAYGKTRIKMVH